MPNIFGYGPILDVGNLGIIEKFIQLSFLTKKICLHGSGMQKLDCLHLDDLMNLLKKIMINSLPCKIFNVSTQKTYTVFEIAKIIFKKFDLEIELSFIDKFTVMPNSPIMSSEKISKYYDWKPNITNLSKKIEEMMNIYSKHIRQI